MTLSYTRQQWGQLHNALKECVGLWQFSHAVTFLGWVVKQMEQKGNEKHRVRSLHLLATVLQDHWGIPLVYAVSCPTEETESPFYFLAQLSRDDSHPALQSAACVCLAALWRALSQLDVLVSPSNEILRRENSAWWIRSLEESSLVIENQKDSYWTNVIQWSLDQWCRVETDETHDPDNDQAGEEIIEKEILMYSASVLLTQFLYDKSTSYWLYSMSEGKWLGLVEQLIEQSQRLLDPNMPMTIFARLSLVSLHLLAVLERRAGRELLHTYEKMLTGNGNGGLVVSMMQSTLQTNGDSTTPRWAVDASQWILPILQEWSKSGNLTSYWEMDTRSEVARAFAKDMVERIRDRGLVKQTKTATFLWLLRETPALCWNVINDLVPKAEWMSFIEALVVLFLQEKGSSIAPACVLRQFLLISQRRRIDATNVKSAHSLIESLCSRASSTFKQNEEKPLLLLLLDSLRLLCESYKCGCDSAINTFAESLISMISPSMQLMVRHTTRFDTDSSMDSAESTPPVNNLSRLDVSAIMPDRSEATIDSPVAFGLEPCVRIAAANYLAVVVNSASGRESREFQSQATVALSEYLVSDDMIPPINNSILVSSSSVFWRASLLRVVATTHEREHFVDAYVGLESSRAQLFHNSKSDVQRLRIRVMLLEQREKQLTKENSSLEAQLLAQSTSAQREHTRLHRKLVIEANESLSAEMAQRVELQREVEDLRVRMKDIREKLEVSEAQNSSLSEKGQQLEQQLKEKSETTNNLGREIETVKRERDDNRERVVRLSKQVESANVAIGSYQKRESQLRDQIAQNEEDLEGLEASRSDMHANLESLFGDMVSLAHAYELKEKEVSTGHEGKEATIEKLEKDLEKERQKRKELEDKYRQAEYENEALSRKYARAREKLEEERRQRSQANESQRSSRRGDVSKSYIQQLQLSTSRSASHSSSRSGKENNPRSVRDSRIS